MRGWSRHGRVCAFAAALLAGCVLVTPLDTPPGGQQSTGGAATSAGRAGEVAEAGQGGRSGSTAGGAPAGDGAAAGAAGEMPEDVAGAGGEPGGGDRCSSNADCIARSANHAPYRCTSEGKCVALTSSSCSLVYDVEAAKADDPIYVGAFAPLPPTQPEASSALYPLRLAQGELSGDANGGLVMPNGKRRPLVLVVCNNCADGSCSASSVDRAADHLIDEVGVSAVLATLLPGDLRRVFENHAQDDVFFLSPVGATSTLTSLDDHDLVWTMLGQPSDLSVVYRDVVSGLVEPYLRNVRGIGSRPLRLALLRGTDAFGAELSSLVLSELVWNGKSASKNGSDYRGFTFDALSPAEVATALIDFVPDVVVSTAGEEVTRAETGVVSLVERQWTGLVAGDASLPFWVLSPFNAGDLAAITHLLDTEMTGADDEPTKRFIGITAASAADRQLQNDYALNLRDAYPSADPDTGNFYDAFYYLAYAIYAAHENDPRGAAIARGMHRLLSGPSFDVGLADIADVTNALKDDSTTIELVGTLGPPAFDQHGIHVDPGSIYCFATSGAGVTVYPDALRYDRASGSFAGNFPCFNGFAP
jgi:hypothetical protein